MSNVVVTGGSGKAGRACITDLLEHGYEVTNVDRVAPATSHCPFTAVDLTDFGQTVEALSGIDGRMRGVTAVVHLAAIPAPGLYPNAVTFANNMLSTYNIFEAARRLGITNVVWASSETVLGLPFDVPPPYVPVDEVYPGRPESAYSLSKLLREEMAKQFCRWNPSSRSLGCAFRISWTQSSMRDSPASRRMLGCGSGTCGAISTHGMRRRPSARHSRRRSPVLTSLSSRMPTP